MISTNKNKKVSKRKISKKRRKNPDLVTSSKLTDRKLTSMKASELIEYIYILVDTPSVFNKKHRASDSIHHYSDVDTMDNEEILEYIGKITERWLELHGQSRFLYKK